MSMSRVFSRTGRPPGARFLVVAVAWLVSLPALAQAVPTAQAVPAAPASSTGERTYKQARANWEAGRYGEACQQFRRLYVAHPSQPALSLGVARCDLRDRAFERARSGAARAEAEVSSRLDELSRQPNASAEVVARYEGATEKARRVSLFGARYLAAQRAREAGDEGAFCGIIAELDQGLAEEGDPQRMRTERSLWLDLAHCALAAGDLGGAHDHALQASAQLDLPDHAREARAFLAELTGAEFTPSATPGAQLTVDGMPAPMGEAVRLPPGEHTWVLTASGYPSSTGTFQVVDMRRARVALPTLAPLPPQRMGESREPFVKSRGTLWVGTGLCAVGATGATVFLLGARNRNREYEEQAAQTGCLECVDGIRQSANSRVYAAWGFGVVGGVGLVAVASSIFFPLDSLFGGDTGGQARAGGGLAIGALLEAPGVVVSGAF